MRKRQVQVTPSFFERNKDFIIAGGVVVLVAGAALTYYYITKKKKKELAQETPSGSTSISSGSTAIYQTPPYIPVSSGSSAVKSVGIKKRWYPLKYRSRHPDVKILQRYLKIYKADLGRFGKNRDGVDGIFGQKTLKAAQKHLGKTVFTESDIQGMKKTLTTLKK